MKEENLRQNAYRCVLLITGAIFAYFATRYCLFLLLPFLLSWGAALCCSRPALWLHRNVKLPLRVCRTFLCLLLLLGGGALLGFLVVRLLEEGWEFAAGWLEEDRLSQVVSFFLRPLRRLSGIEGLGEMLTDSISAILSGAFSQLATALSDVARAVPQILLFSLVTLVSAVYFAWDLEGIHRWIRRCLPGRLSEKLSPLKRGILSNLGKYLRSYLILMVITFAVITPGLLLLRVKYALLLGFLIALLDALPVIGVGTILIPWSIYSFCVRDMRLGIGLLVLYVAHEILRQLIEPRIVGKSLGIHPLLTLVLLYVGYSLFGILGLLLIPVFSVILQFIPLEPRAE